jgi:hypothetical protein
MEDPEDMPMDGESFHEFLQRTGKTVKDFLHERSETTNHVDEDTASRLLSGFEHKLDLLVMITLARLYEPFQEQLANLMLSVENDAKAFLTCAAEGLHDLQSEEGLEILAKAHSRYPGISTPEEILETLGLRLEDMQVLSTQLTHRVAINTVVDVRECLDVYINAIINTGIDLDKDRYLSREWCADVIDSAMLKMAEEK